jgi:hypothetical protein
MATGQLLGEGVIQNIFLKKWGGGKGGYQHPVAMYEGQAEEEEANQSRNTPSKAAAGLTRHSKQSS